MSNGVANELRLILDSYLKEPYAEFSAVGELCKALSLAAHEIDRLDTKTWKLHGDVEQCMSRASRAEEALDACNRALQAAEAEVEALRKKITGSIGFENVVAASVTPIQHTMENGCCFKYDQINLILKDGRHLKLAWEMVSNDSNTYLQSPLWVECQKLPDIPAKQ